MSEPCMRPPRQQKSQVKLRNTILTSCGQVKVTWKAPDANFFCPPLWSLCLFTWSCHYNLQKQAIPKPWVGIGLWNSTQLNFKYCKLICSAMLQKMRLRRRTKRSGTKKSKWQSLSYLMQHAADNCRHDYQVGTNNSNYVRAMGTLGHASRMVTALLIFVSITTW